MAESAEPLDVTTSAELQRLAEQVQKTRQPVLLTRNDVVLAVVQPAPLRKRATQADPGAAPLPRYPTLESLAGAAGSLPEPRPWDEVLEEAREDHLGRKFSQQHE